MLAERCVQLSFQTSNFQFDVEECPAGKPLQDLFQQRERQTLHCRIFNLQTADRRVMADYRSAIRRAAHVELKAVAAVLKAQFERCQCIFRNLPEGARSPMAEQKRWHSSFQFSVLTSQEKR